MILFCGGPWRDALTRSAVGFEEEVAYAQDFFGTAPTLKSNVLTVMSNAMLAPKIGLIRPYVLAGVGLIKTHVDFTTSRGVVFPPSASRQVPRVRVRR